MQSQYLSGRRMELQWKDLKKNTERRKGERKNLRISKKPEKLFKKFNQRTPKILTILSSTNLNFQE
jgi:hypothetical protein